MSLPAFANLQGDYSRLWSGMVVAPSHQAACDKGAHTILAYKGQYQTIGVVPWFVVGIIDLMEAGGGCRRHLHNGDSLSARTHQVPAGRPPAPLMPPFTWRQSALDALALDGLDKVQAWSVELLCYWLERFNGFGYRNRRINTPYLWSYSNQYAEGKFVHDGEYDPKAVSEQAGAMPIFKALIALDASVTFNKPSAIVVPIKAPPLAVPAPSKSFTIGDLVHDVESIVTEFVPWQKAA